MSQNVDLERKEDADEPGKAVDVATSSTLVVEANGARKEIEIVNDSDATMWFRKEATGAVAHECLRLNANGGSYSSDRYNGAICAVHAGSGTKVLTVSET